MSGEYTPRALRTVGDRAREAGVSAINMRSIADDKAVMTVFCDTVVAGVLAMASITAAKDGRDYFNLSDLNRNLPEVKGNILHRLREAFKYMERSLRAHAEYPELYKRTHQELTAPALTIIRNTPLMRVQGVLITACCDIDMARILTYAGGQAMAHDKPFGMSHLQEAIKHITNDFERIQPGKPVVPETKASPNAQPGSAGPELA